MKYVNDYYQQNLHFTSGKEMKTAIKTTHKSVEMLMPPKIRPINVLIAFDTETTSADPKTARVVQIAAIQRTFGSPNGIPSKDTTILNTLCNPGCPIDRVASDVHGITSDMVVGYPSDVDNAQILAEHIWRLADEGNRVVVCGHNSDGFDIPILTRLAGGEIMGERLDTLRLARRLYQNAPNHKLGDLHVGLGLGTAEGAHDALADIKMVLNLLDKCILDSGKSLEQIVEWLRTPHIYHGSIGFGTHRGKKWGDPSLRGWASWCYANFNDVDIKATVAYHYGF
jgi:DNA polymerase III subunit epsilon